MTDPKTPQLLDDAALDGVTDGTAVPPGFRVGSEDGGVPVLGYAGESPGPGPDDEVYPEYAYF